MAITRIFNNQITDATITNVKIASGTLTGDKMNNNLTFNSNLVLNGNLTVTGNVTAVQSTTTQITDPLLTLALGNPGTSYDMGVVLIRGSGGNRFMGYKENANAFVFIQTTEDGLTTGNIATTAYSNVIFGNATTLGSTTLGGFTISGNTLSSAGAMTIRSDAGTVTIANTLVGSGAVNLGSTLSVFGTATVNALTSNGAIIGTTGSFSSNLTASALTVNTSAVITTTLQAAGGLQNTPIGNVTPSTALFTTVGASGNVTASALTVNNTATIGSTLGVTGNINGSGATLTGSIVTTGPGQHLGGLQATPIGNASASTGQFTTLSATGNVTGAGLTSNGSITAITTISGLGGLQATPIGNVTPSTALFTTIGASGNATVSALTVNNSATVGTTLGVTGNATIGNVSTAAIGASGIVTITNTTDATGSGSGALQVSGGASINKNLYVVGNIYAGNIIAIQANTLSVQDPLLYLTANTVFPYNYSIGFFSQYQGGTVANANANIYQHTGFVRDNADSVWKLFSNVVAEPGITVDFTNALYDAIRVGNTTISGTLAVSGATAYSGNVTVNGLTVNTSAVVGTTLQAAGGLQNTPIGNVTPTTALFTTVGASGNATVAALTVNGTATIGSTLGVTGNINGSSLTLTGSQVTTGSARALGGLQATPIGNASPSTALFTTATVSDLLQVNRLTVNTTANIGGDTTIIGNVFIGTGANAAPFTTSPILVGIEAAGAYTQAAIQNTTGTGSSDWVAYANNGTEVHGWMDMGMTGNVFNDTAYTITGFNDGYIFANGVTGNSSLGGNLVIATGSGGAARDIVFATGGFTSNKEVMRFSNSAGALQVKTSTSSTGSTTGALVVTGGVGIQGTLNVQTQANLGNVTHNDTTISSNVTNTGLTINPNGTGTTTFNSGLNNSRTVIQGTTANTFVVTGSQIGVNTATPTSGTVVDFNTNSSIMLPKGTTAARPGTPVAGMFRFSTTQNLPEWYDGTAWAVPSTNFTIVTANTQTGNGSATSFTLPVSNATTAGTMVSINGVVQEPVSAYSISGNVVTFTEAPASTDRIDFRVFVTTTQVTTITDAAGTTGLFYDLPAAASQITTFRTAGSESFSIQANSEARFTGNVVPGANLTYSLGSSTRRWKDAWIGGTTLYLGNIAIKETAANTVGFFALDGTTPATVTSDISDPSGIQSTVIGNATPAFGKFTTLEVTTGIAPTSNATVNIGNVSNQFNTIFAKATSAQYADLAENYSSDAVYEPGTVLHFGGSAEVTVCTEDMCRRVAGVVTTNPAYLMNSGLTGTVAAIALQGRVPCRVTGTVRKGDMMVSAGNGLARAEADPTVGSVIGKSLQDFDGDVGVIEVVIGRV